MRTFNLSDIELTKYLFFTGKGGVGKTTTAKDERFSVVSTPSTDPRKKLDYSAVSVFNDRALGKVNQTCDYDDHDNPIRCEMQVVDESVQPAGTRHYSIKTVSTITEPWA